MHSCAMWIFKAVSRTECDQALIEAEKQITSFCPPFDSIAFTGVSGMLFAPVLAHKMNKEIICVRKHTGSGNTHSEHAIEGYYASKKYLIVDDIVSSGNTIIRIIRKIKETMPDAECVGVYTYSGSLAGCVNGFTGIENSMFAYMKKCGEETPAL